MMRVNFTCRLGWIRECPYSCSTLINTFIYLFPFPSSILHSFTSYNCTLLCLQKSVHSQLSPTYWRFLISCLCVFNKLQSASICIINCQSTLLSLIQNWMRSSQWQLHFLFSLPKHNAHKQPTCSRTIPVLTSRWRQSSTILPLLQH